MLPMCPYITPTYSLGFKRYYFTNVYLICFRFVAVLLGHYSEFLVVFVEVSLYRGNWAHLERESRYLLGHLCFGRRYQWECRLVDTNIRLNVAILV